jgi:DNA-binding transcriptional regulator YiaG
MAMQANETSQLELLLRDVKIQFDELRRVRSENDRLREENEQLRERLEGNEQAEKDELAYYIASQREARKLSLNEFARMLGTNSTTLSNYEKGKGKLKAMSELITKIQKLRRG